MTLVPVKSHLEKEIKTRFSRILDQLSPKYNDIYIKAALLDPSEYLTVDDSYPIDRYLMEILRESQYDKIKEVTLQTQQSSQKEDSQSTYREKLIASRRTKIAEQNDFLSPFRAEEAVIQHYKKIVQSPQIENLTPLNFWKSYGNDILVKFYFL